MVTKAKKGGTKKRAKVLNLKKETVKSLRTDLSTSQDTELDYSVGAYSSHKKSYFGI